MSSRRSRTRAFSILEVVISFAVLGIAAVASTYTLSTTSKARVAAQASQRVGTAVEQLLDQIAATGYTSVVDGSWEVPLACAAPADHLSCVPFARRTVPVTWTTELDETSGTVTVTGSASAHSLSIVRSVTVDPPALADGDARLRLELLVEPGTPEGGTVQLVDAADVVVADRPVNGSETWTVTVPAATCPVEAPCRISLDDGSAAGALTDGERQLSALTGQQIVTSAGLTTVSGAMIGAAS